MEDLAFQLVLQLPGTSQSDFDSILRLEELLASALDGTSHEVEGHDFGSGTGNIFIDTNDPMDAFSLVKMAISLNDYPRLKAAFRSFDEDDYHLIWPEDSSDSFELI